MGKTYNNNEINGEGHVHDLLSAYIDKSLEEPERVRVRAHLEECVDCRADYVELQATSRMLRQMPIAAVPRAFTLTPEMVKGARKTSFWERIFAPRTAPTFASGAVVAFGLLLFLFVGSQFSAPQPTASTSVAYIAPNVGQTESRSAAPGESPEDNTSAAMIAQATTTTAASTDAAPPDDSASKQVSPTQPADVANDTAGAPPEPVGASANAPEPTTLPVGGAGGETQPVPAPLVTPITDIASSDNSSPTTTSLGNPSGSGSTDGDAQGGTAEFMTQQPQTPLVDKFDFFLTVEIGLLVIGLALAGAYLVARRR